MDAVVGLGLFLRFQAENGVTVLANRTGNIFQWFLALKADFGSLTRLHTLDQKFCFDESKRADFSRNIDKEIYRVILTVFCIAIHCSYLLELNMFIIKSSSHFKALSKLGA